MKKRVLSVLLTLALAFTLMPMIPAVVYADVDNYVEVSGVIPCAGEMPAQIPDINVETPEFTLIEVTWYDKWGKPLDTSKPFKTGAVYQVKLSFTAPELIYDGGDESISIDGSYFPWDDDQMIESTVSGNKITFRVAFPPAEPDGFAIALEDENGKTTLDKAGRTYCFKPYNETGSVHYEWYPCDKNGKITGDRLRKNTTGKFTFKSLGYNYGKHYILVKATDDGNHKTKVVLTLKYYYGLGNAKIVIKDRVYNGKSGRAPDITITAKINGKWRTLTKGKDYTIDYMKSAANRKSVGTYWFDIKAKGYYSYYKDPDFYGYDWSFKVKPKGTAVKSVTPGSKKLTVKWDKQSAKMSTSRITGYQVQVATNSKFTKNKKTIKVKGYKNTSKTFKSLKGGKKYYVRVRTYQVVNGKTIYSNWSKVKIRTTKK